LLSRSLAIKNNFYDGFGRSVYIPSSNCLGLCIALLYPVHSFFRSLSQTQNVKVKALLT